MAASDDIMPSRLPMDRAPLENLLLRRFFFAPAFEIHGGCKGLYDYGPPGCAMQENLLDLWRRHFVLEDNLLEINSTCLTPLVVLETSGHVERFKDLMCQDQGNGTCHRADHLLEDKIDDLLAKHEAGTARLSEAQIDEYKLMRVRADDMSAEELGEALAKLNVRSPDTGNELSAPFPFNLMFETKIGPTGTYTGFMRPELAQGIFVNFHRLLEQNGGAVPFGGAAIGRAFRNEISPRQGLLRVREFTLAEIEYFVHPDKKDHERFAEVQDVELNLWPRARQEVADSRYLRMKIGDAVAQGLVANQTLGYYLARCQLFLTSAGARPQWLRFRQHLANEMAHYASDCWDAELLTSYGWIECVGNADRACYDLTVHMKKTGKQMTFYERFDQPRTVDVTSAEPNKGLIGKAFRNDASHVFDYLSSLDSDGVAALAKQMADSADGSVPVVAANGQSYTVTRDMVKFVSRQVKLSGRHIVPSVIEPSYGIGRVQYALLEQCFFQRAGDADRGVLSLAPSIAPIKASVLPLMVKAELLPPARRIARLLTAAGISAKVDMSGNSIGRRYARTDEIGIPFGITVDYVTIEDPSHPHFDTVTLRERDSTKQVRIPIVELPHILTALCTLQTSWTDVLAKYPLQESQPDQDDDDKSTSSTAASSQ